VFKAGVTGFGRLLLCLLLQVGLLLATVPAQAILSSHDVSMYSRSSIMIPADRQGMPDMDMDMATADCDHVPHKAPEPHPHCNDHCVLGACLVDWLMPRVFFHSPAFVSFKARFTPRPLHYPAGFTPALALPPPKEML